MAKSSFEKTEDDLNATHALSDGIEKQASSAVGDSQAQPASWLQSMKQLQTSSRAACAAVACSSAAVLIGYDLMLVGSIIANEEFIKAFGVYDEALEAWSLPANRQLVWTIVQYIAAILGAAGVGQLNDWLGRRMAFLITVTLTFCGTFTELFAPDWKVWVVAKLFFGLAMGFMQGNTPVYVSELAPVHIRGFMLSLFQFWITLGVFISACILEGTSKIDGPWSWKAPVVSQFGTGLICIVLVVWAVPESPYYLVNKGHMNKAEAALRRLRGSEPNYLVADDLQLIQETISHEAAARKEAVSYIECFQGTNLRRTLLACLPMFMQQFLGFTLCNSYLAYFLSLAGLSNSFLITVISQLLGLLAVSVSFLLIERIGRRPQLLYGSICMLPCLLGMGVLGFVNVGSDSNNAGLAAVSILWNIFYYISVGAIGWAVVGEISSVRLRAKTTSIAAMVNAILNLAWAIAIPYLINAEELNLGSKAGFIFLGPGLILVVVLYFCLPETKGKTYEQLDLLFEARTPAREF